MLLIGYKKCSTSAKAEKWLAENGLAYTFRDIKGQNPTEAELREFWQKSTLPLRRFFNTSGQLYRALLLKEKLPTLSESEQLALLASDGMLVKRPILVAEDTVLVGFSQKTWEEALL